MNKSHTPLFSKPYYNNFFQNSNVHCAFVFSVSKNLCFHHPCAASDRKSRLEGRRWDGLERREVHVSSRKSLACGSDFKKEAHKQRAEYSQELTTLFDGIKIGQ